MISARDRARQNVNHHRSGVVPCSTRPPSSRALDPEQRQVAEALRGPVRVLAGAGTGKTRAITHRIAHGVAAGVYQPTEVLAVTFTTRAAGEMRGRLRRLGTDGVQARTFHSAALRQLRYFWPHVHGTELPTLTESKLGMLATAASRPARPARPGPAARHRLRGRVGQGQQRRPRRLRPGRPAHRPLRQRPRRRDRRPALRQLRGGQALPVPHGHGGRPAAHRRPARRRRARRGPGPPPVQVVRRRRVPRRLAPPVGAPRPVARRPRRDLRGRRPRPDHLLLRRRRRGLPPRVPRQVPPHHLDRPGPQLPLHARGDRRRQRPARRHPQRRSPAGLAAVRPGTAVGFQSYADEVAEAEAVAAAVGRPQGQRARRPARSPCCSASTHSPRPTRRRWPPAASPTSSAAPPASSTAPRSARPSPACAAPRAATPACPRETSPSPSAPCSR